MKYFKNIKSFEDLKSQFKALAKQYHPDMGGTVEAMQEVNNEYDILFPVWKIKGNVTTNETADSTRHHFYTSNGWAGSNYKSSRSTKEIAVLIRKSLKELYPTCKFSCVYSSFSGGSSIDVALMQAPYNVFDENYTGDKDNIQHLDFCVRSDTSYRYEPIFNEQASAMIRNVTAIINSYRYDDSDAMIDYFSTNFYYSFNLGKWNKPFTIVPKTARISNKTKTTAIAK